MLVRRRGSRDLMCTWGWFAFVRSCKVRLDIGGGFGFSHDSWRKRLLVRVGGSGCLGCLLDFSVGICAIICVVGVGGVLFGLTKQWIRGF